MRIEIVPIANARAYCLCRFWRQTQIPHGGWRRADATGRLIAWGPLDANVKWVKSVLRTRTLSATNGRPGGVLLGWLRPRSSMGPSRVFRLTTSPPIGDGAPNCRTIARNGADGHSFGWFGPGKRSWRQFERDAQAQGCSIIQNGSAFGPRTAKTAGRGTFCHRGQMGVAAAEVNARFARNRLQSVG